MIARRDQSWGRLDRRGRVPSETPVCLLSEASLRATGTSAAGVAGDTIALWRFELAGIASVVTTERCSYARTERASRRRSATT
jgi:hypothetical protein